MTLNQIRIPFAPRLAEVFPPNLVRARRDFPKLLGLIEASAFLHQHQRERDGDVVIASPQDYRIARELFEHSYGIGPEKAIGELLKAAQSFKHEFSVGQLMGKIQWGKTKTYEVLNRAEEHGYVAPGEKRGWYKFLRFGEDSSLRLPDTI